MSVDPVSLAIKAGMMALQMGLSMMNKIEGPRLDSLDVTTADYGTPMDIFWGLRRLEGRPIIHAEKLREKKVTSKTKGGKYSNYKYYGTFAVLIADHPIDAITRIWMDKHLVWDTTKATPITPFFGFQLGTSGAVKLTQGKNMRVYLGDQTEPDPRYESWCEDRYGPDSAPAYKGISYLFFENLPLEKFGNRIPQITVEAVRNPVQTKLYETVTTSGFEPRFAFSPDYTRFTVGKEAFDTGSLLRLTSGVASDFDEYAYGSNGVIWGLQPGVGLARAGSDGIGATTTYAIPYASYEPIVAYRKSGTDFIGLRSFADSTAYLQVLIGTTVVAQAVDYYPRTYKADSDDNIWAVGKRDGVAGFKLTCISGDRLHDTYTYSGGDGSGSDTDLYVLSDDRFVVRFGSSLYRINNDLTLDTTTADGDGWSHVPFMDTAWKAGSGNFVEYDFATMSVKRTISYAGWGPTESYAYFIYDPVNHAIISYNLSGHITLRYLDRITDTTTTLGEVVEDVADLCGADVDASALTQTVHGYNVTQGAGKDMISPLMDIHDVDARPHDFSLQFLNRGGSVAGTLNTAQFVREQDEPRYTVSITQDTDLPRQITLNFADKDKDQQKNTVVSQRPLDASDTVRTQQIDLTTYAETPEGAQQKADRYFRRQWNEREEIMLSLTPQYLGVEPGDVYNLELDGVTRYARCVETTLTQGRINTKWKRDAVSFATLGSGQGAPLDQRDDEVVYIPAPTRGGVEDIPLIDDAHEAVLPLLYYWAGNYGSATWPGATIYELDVTGEEYNPWNAVESADKASWGYATNALAIASANVWDRGNTVNIKTNAALTSCTEADINADPSVNLALFGTELLNFTTATLETDGTYTLSGFKRGRRGTSAVAHVKGEAFVLADSLFRDGLGLSDLGEDFSFKAQTTGRDPTSGQQVDLTFAGNSMKPYAPCQLKRRWDGTDWTISWVRRTRVGGAWVGGTTIPLGETSESYVLEIYNGSTLVRTVTQTGTSYTYTSANQTTDFGAPITTAPTVKVYQVSANVGRGFALAA